MKKQHHPALLPAVFLIIGITLSSNSMAPEQSDFKETRIGEHYWMVDNLDVAKYRNGDAIPQVTDAEKWKKLKTGAWCWYNNDPKNGKKYGRLYNWYAVNDPRGLAPAGWHVATEDEWEELLDNLGGEQRAGELMKETSSWKYGGVKATNSSGFTARPGGGRYNNRYLSLNDNANFWSTADSNATIAWSRSLSKGGDAVYRSYYGKHWGYSVRCVKD
jgi:uncharacterized protein (TIGR02145 family)